MLLTSNRWSLLVALLVTSGLCLAVSSVMGNAIHILAKQNFAWRGFGSVSIELIAASFVCLVIVSYVPTTHAQLTVKRQVFGLCAVAVLEGALILLAAIGDQWLRSLGAMGIVVWFIELVVAMFLVSHFLCQTLSFSDLQNHIGLIVITFIYTAATKAVFLCLSPGVSIRL